MGHPVARKDNADDTIRSVGYSVGYGQRINLQLNATPNLESTYLFPEADGSPCTAKKSNSHMIILYWEFWIEVQSVNEVQP